MHAEMREPPLGPELDAAGRVAGDKALLVFELVGGGLRIGAKNVLQGFQPAHPHPIDRGLAHLFQRRVRVQADHGVVGIAKGEEIVKAAGDDETGVAMYKCKSGKIGFVLTSGAFQEQAVAILKMHGREATEEWLTGLKAFGKTYTNNMVALKAVEKGEVAAVLVNNYYWYALERERGKLDTKLYYLADGDAGNLVTIEMTDDFPTHLFEKYQVTEV